MVKQIMKIKKINILFYIRESELKKTILFLSLLMPGAIVNTTADKRITLESSVIKVADGTFINADRIEFIRKFCRTLLTFLLGDQLPNNQRKGKYLFYGKWHNIETLARVEQELTMSHKQEKDPKKISLIEDQLATLGELLTHAK